ncbi:hypothetical protein KCP71_17670 [Salmonella enterica subsp. enterica]|nr:hypothetical protein KCP71_17670 [Salmonella enterica subsp. enterica]
MSADGIVPGRTPFVIRVEVGTVEDVSLSRSAQIEEFASVSVRYGRCVARRDAILAGDAQKPRGAFPADAWSAKITSV